MPQSRYIALWLNNLAWLSHAPPRPAVLWNPRFTVLTVSGTGGAMNTITGTPDIPLALESSTNLLTAPWGVLLTTNLAGGSLTLIDQTATNAPLRFYRIAGP